MRNSCAVESEDNGGDDRLYGADVEMVDFSDTEFDSDGESDVISIALDGLLTDLLQTFQQKSRRQKASAF